MRADNTRKLPMVAQSIRSIARRQISCIIAPEHECRKASSAPQDCISTVMVRQRAFLTVARPPDLQVRQLRRPAPAACHRLLLGRPCEAGSAGTYPRDGHQTPFAAPFLPSVSFLTQVQYTSRQLCLPAGIKNPASSSLRCRLVNCGATCDTQQFANGETTTPFIAGVHVVVANQCQSPVAGQLKQASRVASLEGYMSYSSPVLALQVPAAIACLNRELQRRRTTGRSHLQGPHWQSMTLSQSRRQRTSFPIALR